MADLSLRLAALTQWYQRLYDAHMREAPVCNPALSVEATAFRRHGSGWLGVMITPWSMFVVALADDPAAWSELEAGATITWNLPAGACPFCVEREVELGSYQTSRLFSTVAQFANQSQARDAAELVVATLLEPPAPKTPPPAKPGEPKMVGRRGLLRGLLGGGGG
ncbi:MAG TPA: [NiFe]-hydrogenase assembly chaperone HybE [Azospirillaceae bacterium]|nr:[NiFe]-hydrogenase assembly chaperone HybE [Azospirillaceae bacterium]